MKIQIEIEAPTLLLVESELKEVLDNMRIIPGKFTFLKENISEFSTTRINILDGGLKPFMVGIDEAPEGSPEEGMSVQPIQYCSTEEYAQKLTNKYPGSDVYDFSQHYCMVYDKDFLKKV